MSRAVAEAYRSRGVAVGGVAVAWRGRHARSRRAARKIFLNLFAQASPTLLIDRTPARSPVVGVGTWA
jgi:hypothetical protein